MKPIKINLLDHQINTIDYIENKCNNQKGLLLWHYMGTGKTITGLAWLNHIFNHYSESFLIVCPPLIASSWINNSKNLGMYIDRKKIINYTDFRILIETNSEIIKDKYLILDEAHNLIPIVRNLITPDRSYTSINNYITSAKKILLLTATPFSNEKSDLAILINLCAEKAFMPMSQKKWIEKYACQEIFEENLEKGDTYFNYIMPITQKYGSYAFDKITSLIYKIPFFQYQSPREVIMQIWVWPLLMAFCTPKIETLLGKPVQVLQTTSNVISAQRFIGKVNPLPYVLNLYEKLVMNRGDEDQANSFKNNLVLAAKASIVPTILGLVGVVIWNMLSIGWDYLMTFFNYDYREIRDLQYLEIDYEQVGDDIARYVSYYKFQNNPDYATVEEINTPFRSILSLNSQILTILFFFGKVPFNQLSFITDRSIEDLNLDTDLVLNRDGFKYYGRVLSNLPDFFSEFINYTDNYKIDESNGNVKLSNFNDDIILEQSSTKFVTLANYIENEILNNKKKKILIYTDYIEQGAYFLSPYLNSRKIPHIYLNNKLSRDQQLEILDIFNKGNDYQVIILDKDSKEGISLMNITQLHFLEPSINPGVRLQVIGRSVRFQSHKDLPIEDRKVKVFFHSSSLFQDESQKKTILEKIKSFSLKSLLFGNQDQNKFDILLHDAKMKHFGHQFQTTCSAYLDKMLDLNLNYSVQGQRLYGSRKEEINDKQNALKEKKTKNNQEVVLSIDEKLEVQSKSLGYEYAEIQEQISDFSILSDDFEVIEEDNCIVKNDKIQKYFTSNDKKLGGNKISFKNIRQKLSNKNIKKKKIKSIKKNNLKKNNLKKK